MPQVLKPKPQHATILRVFSDNGAHYLRNIRKIKKDHPGKFVAIHNKKVILSEEKMDDLFDALKIKLNETEFFETYVVYVPHGKEVIMA